MPPRWSRLPDRNDADFRRLDDRMTFATHVALFMASNSVVWFLRLLQHPTWTWTSRLTATWAALLVAHALYIFAIANYSTPTAELSSSPQPGDDTKG